MVLFPDGSLLNGSWPLLGVSEPAGGGFSAWLAAIGTICLGLMAIWGERIRLRLFGPRLTIEVPPRADQGSLVQRNNGRWTWYYYLKVTNRRGRAPARNCRVMVRRIQRCHAGGRLEDLKVPTALQHQWSHSEMTSTTPTIPIDQTLDLCYVDEGADKVVPALYSYPNNFEGWTRPGQRLRFHLDIEADNFASRRPQAVEVAWNGKWSRQRGVMCHNVTIAAVHGGLHPCRLRLCLRTAWKRLRSLAAEF